MCPDYQFVFVGPRHGSVGDQLRSLEPIANVHLLGERPSNESARYVDAFDIGAIWFRQTDLTMAVTPLKLYEYLAAGKPVVSTPLPAVEGLPAVWVGQDPDTFAASLLEAAAAERDSALSTESRVVAQEAAWTRRLEPLLQRLEGEGKRRVPL
jgi:hypothetical protein